MTAPTAPVAFEDLSSRQRRIVTFIRDFRAERGYSPTVREICAGVDLISPSSVGYQLGQLVEKGFITKGGDMPRSVVLADEEPCSHCSGTGRVPAGAS